jgi:APA family basic amino acid/polyamine antiporter
MLTLYGLGNILGAGIYVLIGEVAAESGDGLIWSFLIAALVASFTAITYSTLAGKYARSAGAAVYTSKAFNMPLLSTVIGLSIAATAVVSSSALLRGFDRYFQELLIEIGILDDRLPAILFMIPLLVLLTSIALRGMKESAKLAVVLTILEASGLLLIVGVAIAQGDIGGSLQTSLSSLSSVEPLAIGLGGFLAFYAFVGFEDMVNVAEEVKNPETSMRKGMISALIIASVLYVLVAISALAVLSSGQLAESKAPLAAVFQEATNLSIPVITIIGVIAITNGVLIQIITGSRILYGLAREKWLPKQLAVVSAKQHTPTRATLVVVSLIAITSSLLPLGTLAQITSFILLVIFTVVHLSAIKLITTKQINNLKMYIPVLGIIANSAVIALQVSSWFGLI